MGLGKTLQTLAHLQIEKNEGRLDCPALVVAPTSLIFHWRREAARFAPGLRVLVLHGSDRRRHSALLHHADMVLTPSALLGRDFDSLRNPPWSLPPARGYSRARV